MVTSYGGNCRLHDNILLFCYSYFDLLQFGFMPRKGATDALFVVRRMQEEYKDKRKKLYMCFVHIEKEFDRANRNVMKWAILWMGLPGRVEYNGMGMF